MGRTPLQQQEPELREAATAGEPNEEVLGPPGGPEDVADVEEDLFYSPGDNPRPFPHSNRRSERVARQRRDLAS